MATIFQNDTDVRRKVCAKCGVEKPAYDFHRQTSRADGRHPWCKECGKKWRAKYTAENAPKIREYERRYRLRNEEVISAKQKKYRERNSAGRAERAAAYYKANAEKFRATARGRRELDPEGERRRQRAWRLVNHFGISESRYEEMLKAQCGVCAICKKPEDAKQLGTRCYLAVDHDHACCRGPRSCGKCVRGLLCARCNSMIGMAHDSRDVLESAIAYLGRR